MAAEDDLRKLGDEFMDALQAKDLAKLTALAEPDFQEKLKTIPPEAVGEMLEFMASQTPREVLEGEWKVDGETAVLHWAKEIDGGKEEITIHFRRIDGAWMLAAPSE